MIYAVGDIHGELRKLKGLLAKIETNGLSERDRIVFLGDYIDRGPDTPGVLDFLINLKIKRPNSIFLRGNHDQVMLDARDLFDRTRKSDLGFEDISWWFSYGGRETIESYPPGTKWYDRIPASHWEFLEATELEFTEGKYAFVHAGFVPPDKKWKEKEDPRMWIRELFIGSKADFGKVIVFGHTPQDLFMPLVMKNKVGVDTGAAYGGPLTAFQVDPNATFDRDTAKFIQFT